MSVYQSLIPYAYAAVDPTAFGKVVDPIFANIINPVIQILFGVGAFVFVWGIVEMLSQGDSPEALKTGRWHMLAGAFGMFIMLSAWGIIRLIASTIGGISK